MFGRLVKRLNYANVVATLALFFALSTGVVYAANEWTGANIVDGSLNYLDIAVDGIGGGRIANESLTGADIEDGSLTQADLGANSVDDSEIATGAVTASEIVANAVGSSEIAAGAVGSSELLNDAVALVDLKGVDVSARFTAPAGYVASSRCRQGFLVATGVRVGDVLLVEFKEHPPQGIYFSYTSVLDDDLIILHMCNLTGGPSPVMTDFPVRVISLR
jgi:hypothetical protein